MIHMIRTPKLPFIQSRASAPVTFLTMTGITILTVIPFTIFGKTSWVCGTASSILCISASVYPIVYGFSNKLEKGLCPSFWRIALRRCNNELERTLDDAFWNYRMAWSEHRILGGFSCCITNCNSYDVLFWSMKPKTDTKNCPNKKKRRIKRNVGITTSNPQKQ